MSDSDKYEMFIANKYCKEANEKYQACIKAIRLAKSNPLDSGECAEFKKAFESCMKYAFEKETNPQVWNGCNYVSYPVEKNKFDNQDNK